MSLVSLDLGKVYSTPRFCRGVLFLLGRLKLCFQRGSVAGHIDRSPDRVRFGPSLAVEYQRPLRQIFLQTVTAEPARPLANGKKAPVFLGFLAAQVFFGFLLAYLAPTNRLWVWQVIT